MHRSRLSLFAACLLALLLAACASAPDLGVPQVPRGQSLPAPDLVTDRGTAQDYRLGAQDVIEVLVFGVPDLSRTARVNSDGSISLPLVGGVPAAGRTVAELESDLTQRYAHGYLQHPQVSVLVKEFNSQRMTLEGAIKNPGVYPVTGRMSLIQAIATAGGLDPLADLGGIVLFRQVDGQRKAAVYDMRALRRATVPDPQLYAGDVIVVEQSNSKTALRRFIEAIPALGLFLALPRP